MMMNCVHCGRPTSETCYQCGRPVCPGCSVPDRGGHTLCRDCAVGRGGTKDIVPPGGPKDYEGPRTME